MGRFSCSMAMILGLAALLATVGCGGREGEITPTAARLQAIINGYLDYAVASGEAPANEEQLRACIAGSPAFLVAMSQHGIGTIDELFVSPRDGHRFVIVFGVPVTFAPGTLAAPVVYERNGQDGTRFVAFANGTVECMEEELDMLMLGAL